MGWKVAQVGNKNVDSLWGAWEVFFVDKLHLAIEEVQ